MPSKNSKKLDYIFHFYPMIVFSFIALIYILFRIQIHTWESYMYADCLEGFVDIRDKIFEFTGEKTNYPDFNKYHPNHPLLHFISYYTHRILLSFSFNINSLLIVQSFNICFGLLGLWLHFKIAFLLSKSRFFSTTSTATIAFTSVYWYQSLSGEVYISALFWLLVAMHRLILIENRLRTKKNVHSHVFILTIVFNISVAFHLLAAPFFIVIIFFFYRLSQQYALFLLQKSVLFLITTSTLSFFIFYVCPFLFKVSSVEQYFNTLFYYKNILGVWNSDFKTSSLFWELFRAQQTGIHYFLSAILFPVNEFSVIFHYTIGTLTFFLFLNFRIKTKNIVMDALLVWFIIYFILFTTILHVPEVNDYWCLNFYPFLLYLLLSLKNFLKLQWLILFPITFFLINFNYDILPKATINKHNHFFYYLIEDKIKDVEHIVFALYSEDFELLTNQKSHFYRRAKQKKIFEITNNQGYEEKLNLIIAASKPFVLLTRKGQEQRIKEIDKYILNQGYKVQTVFELKIKEDIRKHKLAMFTPSMLFDTDSDYFQWGILGYFYHKPIEK